ncbi:MAG TPA: hypothetical protein VK509_24640 [Polyangiales bacterium]|jgi:hypothetical protein|nr:hypothetical protein [Polyangiales bacterium]
MEPTQDVVQLVEDKAWIPLAAVLIGLVVRLSKSDKFAAWFPINVPPKWRAPFALGLGLVAAVVSEVAKGGNWKAAIVGGLFASFMAITSHDIVVEGARDGREIGQKPIQPKVLMMLVLWAGVAAVHGCGAGSKETACQLLRVAADGCPYFTVLLADGTREEVPREEIAGMAMRHRGMRLAQPPGDAGADR